ncbi:MAG: 30S ribosomal protein S17 [Chloroflexi bacterium CFX6]|nr:30S ribosomal protein S17 [Chloroflexi bacterium CFX6]
MPRRRLKGTVLSNGMDKTAVVQIERMKAHPLYHKVIRRRKKYMAHDEANEAQLGDIVVIEECRPLSRHKRWQIVEWIKRGGQA